VGGPVQTVATTEVGPNSEYAAFNKRLEQLEDIVTKAAPNRELAAINKRLGQVEGIMTKVLGIMTKSSQEDTARRQPSIQVRKTWGTDQLGWVFPEEISEYSHEPVPSDDTAQPAENTTKASRPRPTPPRLPSLPRSKPSPSRKKTLPSRHARSSGTVDDSAEDPAVDHTRGEYGDKLNGSQRGHALLEERLIHCDGIDRASVHLHTNGTGQRRPGHTQPQVTGWQRGPMYSHSSPKPTLGALSNHRVAQPPQVTSSTDIWQAGGATMYGRDPRQPLPADGERHELSVLGPLQDARQSPDLTLRPVQSPTIAGPQGIQRAPSATARHSHQTSPDPTLPPSPSGADTSPHRVHPGRHYSPNPTRPPIESLTHVHQVAPQPSEATAPVKDLADQHVGALEAQMEAQVKALRALTNALTSRAQNSSAPEQASASSSSPKQAPKQVSAPEPKQAFALEPNQAEPKRAPPAPLPHSELRADDIFYRKLQSSLGRQLIKKSVDAILEGNLNQKTQPTQAWSTKPVRDFWNEIDGATAAKLFRFVVGNAERWGKN